MSGIVLNLGCGETWSHARPPWVNIDIRPEVQPDLIADVRELPYLDGQVERIYAGHVLEHLPYDEVGPTLAEWWRILEPGGGLLLVGPDEDKTRRLVAAGTITAERAASNDGATDEHNPALHSWFSSARRVLPLCWEVGFEAREVPIVDVMTFGFPVYDPVTPDQYAVICRKNA